MAKPSQPEWRNNYIPQRREQREPTSAIKHPEWLHTDEHKEDEDPEGKSCYCLLKEHLHFDHESLAHKAEGPNHEEDCSHLHMLMRYAGELTLKS